MNNYTIYEWMTKLNLTPLQTMIYAIIYMVQNSHPAFPAKDGEYLHQLTNASYEAINKSLAYLVERGLLSAYERGDGKIQFEINEMNPLEKVINNEYITEDEFNSMDDNDKLTAFMTIQAEHANNADTYNTY